MRDPFAHRHRKPTRLRKLAGYAVFTAATALTAAGVMLATSQPAPPPVVPANIVQLAAPAAVLDAHTTGSPAQDEAACVAVYHYHHLNALNWQQGTYGQQLAWLAAFDHAWHTANYADHDMRQAIHTWLAYGKPWTAVWYACNPDSSI